MHLDYRESRQAHIQVHTSTLRQSLQTQGQRGTTFNRDTRKRQQQGTQLDRGHRSRSAWYRAESGPWRRRCLRQDRGLSLQACEEMRASAASAGGAHGSGHAASEVTHP